MSEVEKSADSGNDAVGSWIRMDSRLEGTEEFMAILCALDLDRMGQDGVDILLGTLKRFWTWFDERTEAGFMRFATERSIDAKIGRPGFAAAMIRVEWLAITEQGAQLPEFEKRHGKSEKKRMEGARRARRSRRLAKEEQELRAAGVLPDDMPRTASAREAHGKRTRSAHTTTTTDTNTPAAAFSGAVPDDPEAAAAAEGIPDDWRSVFDAVQEAAVIYPHSAIAGARQQGHTPETALAVCRAYLANADVIGDAGFLHTRLTKVAARVPPHEGWGGKKKLRVDRAPPPRNAEVVRAEFFKQGRSKGVPDERIERLWRERQSQVQGVA